MGFELGSQEQERDSMTHKWLKLKWFLTNRGLKTKFGYRFTTWSHIIRGLQLLTIQYYLWPRTLSHSTSSCTIRRLDLLYTWRSSGFRWVTNCRVQYLGPRIPSVSYQSDLTTIKDPIDTVTIGKKNRLANVEFDFCHCRRFDITLL